MKIVVKVGGSVSMGEFGPDFSYFSRLLPLLRALKGKNQLIVAIGGGSLTRKYGKSIEKFSLKNEEKEKIFIELIKANVLLVSYSLGMRPLFRIEEIDQNTSGVIGGIIPGRSTDANAAIAAKIIDADLFVKLSDVEGIFDKDPKKFKNAKKIDSMTFSDLKKFSVKGMPNNYGILDATAIRTLDEAGIRTIIVSGKDPRNLAKAVAGEPVGTLIS